LGDHIRASPIISKKSVGKSMSFLSDYKKSGAYLSGSSNSF